jgi:membrane protease YdiL (CAAX protease family)
MKRQKGSLKEYLKLDAGKDTMKNIVCGLAIGFFSMLCIYLIELQFGFIGCKAIAVPGTSFLIFLAELVLGAFGEELMFRGFLLNGIIHISKSRILAVIVTSVLFGLAHAGNPNATTLSIVSNALGGLMYSAAFILCDSIWLSFAIHFSWNFFQGPIFGFPVSGMDFGGIVTQQILSDKIWLFGGKYGPEGGIIGIAFRLLIILMTVLYCQYLLKRKSAAIQ